MRVCLLSVFVASWMSSVLGISVNIYPPDPVINDNVIFNVLDIVGTFRFAEWFRGQGTNATNQIIRVNSLREVSLGPKNFTEASLFPNGSLQISNAQISHEGYYTVSVQADQLLQYTVYLVLHDPNNESLSGGAIAGIVLGVLAAVAIIILTVVYFFKKKNNSPEKEREEVL